MNVKQSISAIAATLLIASATTAAADQGKKNKRERNQDRPAAAAAGIGVTSADRRGAVAAGAVEAQFQGGRGATGNAATTFGSGATFNDRNTASGAVSTGGAAAGTGVQSTTSDVSAYGTVDRQAGYTEAQVSGSSTATSGERPRRRPR